MPKLSLRLTEELQTLERHWETITQTPETPKTAMQIIEYSLDSHGKAEVYVTRLLRYLLDPDAPHGMGPEFLQAFLEGVADHQQGLTTSDIRVFQEDIFDLTDADVQDQIEVTHEETDRMGIADVFVEVPNEWFLLIELKFEASENNLSGPGLSQTEHYFDATHVTGTPKDSYESDGHYLFLHRRDSAPARESAFTNWSWKAFAEDALSEFINNHAPRYPHRTVVQLRAFQDDIHAITDMSEQQANEREKIELYLEHYDAINDVTSTFERRWKQYVDEWAEHVQHALADAGIDTENWIFHTRGKDWGFIFKHGWWRRTDDLTPIKTRPDDRNDVRIGFHHRLDANRERAIGEQTLQFMFRNMGANDTTFIERFNRTLAADEPEVVRLLPNNAELASITDTRRDLIEWRFDIPVEEYDDFFDAYTAAVSNAFTEIVEQRSEFISIIDAVFEDSIEMYE